MFCAAGLMHYVYLLESVSDQNRHYVGFSMDLRQRFADHNAGKLPTTAKYRPWKLVTYLVFHQKSRPSPSNVT